MRKQTPTVEWNLAENDAEWVRLCALPVPDRTPGAARAAQSYLFALRFPGSMAVIFLLLVSASGWWWHTAQTGSQQAEVRATAGAERDLRAIAASDSSVAARFTDERATLCWDPYFAQKHYDLCTAAQSSDREDRLDIPLDTVEVQGDQIVASVIISAPNGAPAYRQTRFYRRTATGWLQTEPHAALWGSARSLETPFFIYHFHQHDTAAVIVVAPQIDALYTILRHNVGLGLPPGTEKRVIDVSITHTPGAGSWFSVADGFVVASPALYWAPVALSEAELLAQSIALPVLTDVLAQASERYAIGAGWQPLVDGLRLWEVWEMGLPLSAWREDVVRWIYADLPTSSPGQPFVLPERYPALCAAHKLWMPSPVQIRIPLFCLPPVREEEYFPLRYSLDPPRRLDQFSVPAPRSLAESFLDPASASHPGQAVALATLVEYAVAAYGRERLPALVAGLGQYESWDTLLPAVFGVSPAEFEAGWQAYLAVQYGV